MRFVFVINSLTGGGAERAMVNLLGFLRERLADHEVHLVLLDREPDRHTVGNWVKRTTLDARHGLLSSFWQLWRRLADLKPDVTVSFLTRSNCANVLASSLLRRPCVISERVHTTSHFGGGLKSLGQRLLVRLFYPRADHVVAVSSNVREDLVENFGLSPAAVSVIGNGISIEMIEGRAAEVPEIALPEEFILAAGRLVPTKNFSLLIEAYLRSGVETPLVILGEGPERARLEAMVASAGASARILLPGYVANPYPIVRSAKAFVSSSNAEGFPNALVEAMALGCPVVATDCEAGPAEILQAGRRAQDAVLRAEYGLLVPVNAPGPLAEAMAMMACEPMRSDFAGRAKRRAMDFSPEQVARCYLAVLAQVTRRPELAMEPAGKAAVQEA
ncbi:MAG TPA: glycosyltransferase [Bosea sp. (in: a-proteobacteria)]